MIDVLIVAGEASADLHGAALLKELRKIHPDLRCFGVGGKQLAEAGMEILVPADSLNVVGLTDWWEKIREVWRDYRLLLREAKRRGPHCAILLDLPDFNLLLAGKLKKMGVPIAYYISPQVWAWRKYRVKKIRTCVEQMLVLFPFEKKFYEKNNVPCTFVGHPLIESLQPRKLLRNLDTILSGPRIALLPGSRLSEVKYHTPILSKLCEKLSLKYPNAVFRVPVASTLSKDLVQSHFSNSNVEIEEGSAREVLAWADVAVVASGTATLETALIGTPLCLLYRLSKSSEFFCRYILRYRGFLGMPNLLLGKEVVREFFQEKATPENLYKECIRLLEDSDYRSNHHQALLQIRAQLGDVGASARAAREINKVLEKHYAPLSQLTHQPQLS